MHSSRPEPIDIHQRFGRAPLQVALEGTGQVHLDVPVESEPMDIGSWEPRRSTNDKVPAHVSAPIPRSSSSKVSWAPPWEARA